MKKIEVNNFLLNFLEQLIITLYNVFYNDTSIYVVDHNNNDITDGKDDHNPF